MLARMRSGFAVLADAQFLPGYCILLGYPMAGSLNGLEPGRRAEFLTDMAIVGDAIIAVCNSVRVNYEILGNTDAYLHAHIVPRYAWEEEERRKTPVWLYPKDAWSAAEHRFDAEKHAELKGKLTEKLKELTAEVYR